MNAQRYAVVRTARNTYFIVEYRKSIIFSPAVEPVTVEFIGSYNACHMYMFGGHC